jgi:hypothetical protein
MKFRSLIVRLYFSAVCDDFILVDDNTRPHHARIGIGTIGRIDWPSKIDRSTGFLKCMKSVSNSFSFFKTFTRLILNETLFSRWCLKTSDYFILVDDNTRPHHARIGIGTIGRIDWPSKGINPIEHLWDILERRNWSWLNQSNPLQALADAVLSESKRTYQVECQILLHSF